MRYFRFFETLVRGSGSCFERQREGDFARRGFTGAAARAGRQAVLRLPLQCLCKLLRTQWTSALRTAANRPKLGFHFFLFQELAPARLAPGCVTRRHFQAGVGVRRTAMGGGARPGPSRHPRPHGIQLRIAQSRPQVASIHGTGVSRRAAFPHEFALFNVGPPRAPTNLRATCCLGHPPGSRGKWGPLIRPRPSATFSQGRRRGLGAAGAVLWRGQDAHAPAGGTPAVRLRTPAFSGAEGNHECCPYDARVALTGTRVPGSSPALVRLRAHLVGGVKVPSKST